MTSQLLQSPGKIALTISLILPLFIGCTTTQAVDQTSYKTVATQASFSEAQLDSLLAPIALYPDTVLSHVLIAATYPIEVVEADRWARNNTRLKGDDAVDAVDSRDWDPSVKALVAFPDILQRMSEDLDWTQQLGDAFLDDEARVMDSIQKLRNRAYAAGNLDKVEHVRVIREEKTIVIEPSVERVVYVPAYDSRVIYGNWWWADYPPVYWHYPSSYVFVSGFYWGPRVYIGPRFYFSGCHWRDRRVVVVDYHQHNHRFYDSRSLVRYNDAKHWHHNPVHRRGVAYHDNFTRERFHSPRESQRDSRDYRTNLRRDNATNNVGGRIVPNRARDQRQGRDLQQGRNEQRNEQQRRDEQLQQRRDPRQAGQVVTSTNRPLQQQSQQQPQARADQLRERMNVRSDRQQNDRQLNSRTTDNRENARANSTRTINSNNGNAGSNTANRWESRADQNRTQDITRTESPRLQAQQRIERPQVTAQPRYERPQTGQSEPRQAARIEPSRTVERTETPNRVERIERPERAERIERPERSGGGRESMERSEMRGGRER
jgi:hypothetical protein